jgi:hypothetical protein
VLAFHKGAWPNTRVKRSIPYVAVTIEPESPIALGAQSVVRVRANPTRAFLFELILHQPRCCCILTKGLDETEWLDA